jgi:hypothetical protein
MHRLTTNHLRLNPTAEHNSLRLLGAFRPVLGGILGLVVYVLISGDLLNISVPPGSPIKTPYFLAGLAFLAGFSERLAQDTLTRATPQAMPANVTSAETKLAESLEKSTARPAPTGPGAL